MQVNPGMQMMNGQPQQGYPPQANPPYSSAAQFVPPGQRPPAPYQQFNQLPASANYPPAPGNVDLCSARSVNPFSPTRFLILAKMSLRKSSPPYWSNPPF